MLASLAECPIPHTFSLELDPDLNQEAESRAGWPWLDDFPSPVRDDIEPSFNVNDHLIRNPESTFLVRVIGEALADAGLHDGDLLIMDRATPPLAGNVVLAVVEGAAVLARLGRDAQGQLFVQSGLEPVRLLDNTITMAGVARWVIHRLWPGRLSS